MVVPIDRFTGRFRFRFFAGARFQNNQLRLSSKRLDANQGGKALSVDRSCGQRQAACGEDIAQILHPFFRNRSVARD